MIRPFIQTNSKKFQVDFNLENSVTNKRDLRLAEIVSNRIFVLLLTRIRNTPIRITPYGRYFFYLNSNTIEYTLLNSNWIGENTPYSYTISLGDTYTLTNNSKVDIGASLSCSDTQLESLMALSLCGGSIDTESNSITLKAFGEKPSIDIPISILIREEIVHE